MARGIKPSRLSLVDADEWNSVQKELMLTGRAVSVDRGLASVLIMGGCLGLIRGWFKSTRHFNINGKRLKEIHQIAEGGYGYVLLVQDTDSKCHYALKKLICQTAEQRDNYKNEVEVMKKLSGCPHVVTYYGSYEVQKKDFLQAFILMELAEKTVFDLLSEVDKKGQDLTEGQILRILRDTALGLSEMHELGVFHHDVKVENVLLTKEGTAKLCDLGSCSSEAIDLECVTKSAMYQHEQRFEKNTTLMYRPPEMIDLYLKYPIDGQVDVWMLGCVLFVLNYRYHPFQDEGKLSIVNASIRYKKGTHSPKMEDLMRHMLTPNPHFRASVAQVLAILDSWDSLQQVPLNKVAQIIKQDEEHVERGEYHRTTNGSWRNLKP